MHTHPRPRPRLYLDVDGVLNAEAPRFDDVQGAIVKDRHGAGYETRYLIRWSPTVVAGIEALREQFSVELVWLTTWLGSKTMLDDLVAAVGGLASGRRLVMPPRKLSGYISADWKRGAILADLARDPVPYIWADDVEVPLHAVFVRAAFPSVKFLQIAPLPENGLTREHLAEIRTFLEGV